MLNSLVVILEPFIYHLGTIWLHNSYIECMSWLEAELLRLGVEPLHAISDIEKYQTLITSFAENASIYNVTLFLQGLTFILPAIVLKWLTKRRLSFISKHCFIFTFLFYAIGHILGILLGGLAIDEICGGFVMNLSRPDFYMLFPPINIMNNLFMLNVSNPIYKLYGLAGVILEVYILYAIYSIIAGKCEEYYNK